MLASVGCIAEKPVPSVAITPYSYSLVSLSSAFTAPPLSACPSISAALHIAYVRRPWFCSCSTVSRSPEKGSLIGGDHVGTFVEPTSHTCRRSPSHDDTATRYSVAPGTASHDIWSVPLGLTP